MTTTEAAPVAVLFVPDVASRASDDTDVTEIARRIARQLDHQDREVSVRYEMRAAPTEPYGSGDENRFADVREIVRATPGSEPVVTHRIYRLNYDAQLAEANPATNLVVQFWTVLVLGFKWTGRFVRRAATAESMRAREKTAFAVGGAALALVFAYLVALAAGIIFWAATSTDLQLPGMESLEGLWTWLKGTAAVQGVKHWMDSLIPGSAKGTFDAARISLAVAAVLGVAGFSFSAVRESIARVIDMYLRFSRYFDGGCGRAACVGQFNDLLEHILDREEPPSRVDVLSYSMGSIIAIDALMPSNGEPVPRLASIRTLTTIGCPFDLVRTFWPGYFERRTVVRAEMRWINVYSPVDLLGSNFSNESGPVPEPTHGINGSNPFRGKSARTRADGEPAAAPEATAVRKPDANICYDHAGRTRISWWEVLVFGGYLAHTQYWTKGRVEAESCFTPLVARLYV